MFLKVFHIEYYAKPCQRNVSMFLILLYRQVRYISTKTNDAYPDTQKYTYKAF